MNKLKSTAILILIAGCVFSKPLRAQKLSDQKPNIIFILTDDQRFDALGYAGNKLISTPEMDKLAAEGTHFKNAMVTTPICAASRASILTGVYERTHNFNFRTGNIREEYMETSYPRLLKDAGYYTGFYGKYGVRYDGLDRQFDVYESYDRNNRYPDRRGYYYKMLGKDSVHLTRYTGQRAMDFIDNVDRDTPFCLSLSFSAPHAHDSAKDQYYWQEETDALLKGIKMPGPELDHKKYFDDQPEFVKSGFNRLRWTWRYDTPEKYQHSVKGYYRMISGIDLEIAKIRDVLKKKGLEKNTVIILMGDNGYFLGERQMAGKWLLYDNSVRVPLIIYDPRVKKHQDSDELALNVDVPSTIIDLAGLEHPKSWHGKSLMPIVSGESTGLARDTVLIEHLWEFEHIPPSEGVRTKKWKYFRYVNDKSYEELYNLEKDPAETRNLGKNQKYKKVLQKFREECDELGVQYSDAYSNPPNDISVELTKGDRGIIVDDPSPEFGWVVPQAAIEQQAYQILVGSSKEKLENNIGDVWDSGQVRGNTSSNVSYSGKTLVTEKKYYWKVRIWDTDNRLLNYSKSQEFKILSGSSILNKPDRIKTSYKEQLETYANTGDFAGARNNIEYLVQEAQKSNELQKQLILMFYEDYVQTGDTELIAKYYNEIKSYVRSTKANDERYFKNLEIMKIFAGALNLSGEELEYGISSLQLKKYIYKQLPAGQSTKKLEETWGIRPKIPGYGIASIKPQLGTLKKGSVVVPTIKGSIKGDYHYVSERLQKYIIEIPANMVAEFEVSASKEQTIKLNGEMVSAAFGSIRLVPGVNHIEFEVNSF